MASKPTEGVRFLHVARTENRHVDALADLASILPNAEGRRIYIGTKYTSCLEENTYKTMAVEKMTESWMDPIVSYLKDEILATDGKQTRHKKQISKRFTLVASRRAVQKKQ